MASERRIHLWRLRLSCDASEAAIFDFHEFTVAVFESFGDAAEAGDYT